MPHANAPLSELGRLRLARCIVEDGWSIRTAAERFQVSATTAARWAGRYRQSGPAGMVDRSSRPRRSPTATPAPVVRKIKHLRTKKRLGPVQIGGRVGVAASTVHAVLVREGLNRLDHLDRGTGLPVRRYEKDRPGEQVHVDVKKLGLIPPGGGWRIHGRAVGGRNARRRRTAQQTGRAGYGFVHSMLDDHSRLTYSEILRDETAATTIAFTERALAWFTEHGIAVEEILSDNGANYRSAAFAEFLTARGIRHRRTRPYRPQTNGKIERFHRTLANEWAYARAYRSESARRAALPRWLHIYNHHRPHTALGGRPPASRVPNLTGQNI
jgi:transposase InsO family protein